MPEDDGKRFDVTLDLFQHVGEFRLLDHQPFVRLASIRFVFLHADNAVLLFDLLSAHNRIADVPDNSLPGRQTAEDTFVSPRSLGPLEEPAYPPPARPLSSL